MKSFKEFKNISELPPKISVFPLAGALLLPRTQLPLNIFEPRYVQMIDNALALPGRVIGMIQPSKPGEKTLKKVAAKHLEDDFKLACSFSYH